MRGLEFKVRPIDGSVFHKRALLIQVGSWKLEIKKQQAKGQPCEEYVK